MRITATFLAVGLCSGLLAQQDVFRSRLTLSTGMAGLRGDIDGRITTEGNSDLLTGGLAYEYFLSDGVSIRSGLDHLILTGNDLNSGRTDRALNFRTTVNALQLGLRFYADNGRLLNYDARVAPFFGIGIGVGMYDVKGDLFTANGARYHYWSDGSIRDQAESGPFAESAQLLTQDGNYETDLTDRATESGKPSEPNFLFIPATIGLKWRINGRLSAELAFAYQWTFTDHLDDVSDAYPSTSTSPELALISNPTGRVGQRGDPSTSDHITRISLGLAYSFGRRSHRYRMPPMHAYGITKVEIATVSSAPAVNAVPPTTPDTLRDRPMIIHVDRIEVGKLIVDTLIVRGEGLTPTRDTLRSVGIDELNVREIPLDSLRNTPAKELAGTEENATTAIPPIVLDSLRRSVPAVPLDTTANVTEKDSLSESAQQETVVLDDTATIKTSHSKQVIPVLRDSTQVKGDARTAQPDTVSTTVKGVERSTLPDTLETPVKETRPGAPEQPVPDVRIKKLEAENRALRSRADSLQRALAKQPQPRTITITEQVPVVKEVQSAPARTSEKERVVPVVIPVPAADSAEVPRPQRVDSLKKAAVPPVVAPTRTVVQNRDGALGRLDSTMAERIRTLELYIRADSAAATHDLDSLLERINALDARLDSVRNDLRRMAATPRTEVPSSEPLAVSPTRTTVVMDTLTFDLGSSRVRAADRVRIVALAARIKDGKVERVLVTGHSDRSGDARFNLQLTQQRADAVAAILRNEGVPTSIIKSTGMGEKLARTLYDPNERFVAVQFKIHIRE